MPRQDFNETMFQMVDSLGELSTCPRKRAGAISVNRLKRITGYGFNGVPSGFPHCTDYPCPGANDPPGDTRRCLAIHCEQNLFLNTTGEIHVLYLTASPCKVCALMLANILSLRAPRVASTQSVSGITAPGVWRGIVTPGILYKETYSDPLGLSILRQAGVLTAQWSDCKPQD